MKYIIILLLCIQIFASDFSYSYGDPYANNADDYIHSTDNIARRTEGNVRSWTPVVGNDTKSNPGTLIYRFTFDKPIESANLYATLCSYHWSYSQGYGYLSGSVDGYTWHLLAEAPPPAFGEVTFVAYNQDLPELFKGTKEIWLQINLYAYGPSGSLGGSATNTAQHSRYDTSNPKTTFKLDVTFEKSSPSVPAIDLNSHTGILEVELLINSLYNVSGSFAPYNFSGVEDAFDWTFTTPDQDVYQLQGLAPSQSSVFGWKKVNVTPSEAMWQMLYLGDWDLDGDGRFDWLLVGTSGNAVYKLDGVTEAGTFAYSEAIDIPYTISEDKKSVTFGDWGLPEGTITYPDSGDVVVHFEADNGVYIDLVGTDTEHIDEIRGNTGDNPFVITYKNSLLFTYESGNTQMNFFYEGSVVSGFQYIVDGEIVYEDTTFLKAPSLLRNCNDIEGSLQMIKDLKGQIRTIVFKVLGSVISTTSPVASDPYILKLVWGVIMANPNLAVIISENASMIQMLQNEVDICIDVCDSGYFKCGDSCILIGMMCCSNGTFCNAGETCLAGGGCGFPCGERYCEIGTTCCNGTSCCQTGSTCLSVGCCPDGWVGCGASSCMPPDAVCCSDGRYCLAGSICNNDGTCTTTY